jgi:hypothetical protein
MNYRTISSKHIVERVFGLMGNTISQDSDRFLGNVIEWIGGGLELIGILPAMSKKSVVYKVEGGRIPIPCNLYLIESVAYDNQWLPYGSQTFNYDLHCEECVNSVDAGDLPFSYTVNDNYLMTNVPDEDEICITFLAFAIDEDGFPEIPDKETVKQALFWFVLRSLMLGGFEHPNRQITFQTVDEMWRRYCGQAEVDLNMMDTPRLETFKRMWVRLIPEVNWADNFFATGTQKEIVKQHYNLKTR